MKHIILLAVALLLGGTAAAQQNDQTAEQNARIEAVLAEYYEKLDLKEEQKPGFAEITKRYGEQLRALRESDKSRMGKYKEYNAILKSKNAEMQEILTEAQYEKFLVTQEEIQKRMRESN